jgi:hypothetical protein
MIRAVIRMKNMFINRIALLMMSFNIWFKFIELINKSSVIIADRYAVNEKSSGRDLGTILSNSLEESVENSSK